MPRVCDLLDEDFESDVDVKPYLAYQTPSSPGPRRRRQGRPFNEELAFSDEPSAPLRVGRKRSTKDRLAKGIYARRKPRNADTNMILICSWGFIVILIGLLVWAYRENITSLLEFNHLKYFQK